MMYGRFRVVHGTKVTIRIPHGEITGRAVGLLLFPEHCVLNCGGKHGTPRVADANNIVRVG